MKKRIIAHILCSLLLVCCCFAPVRAQEPAGIMKTPEGMYTLRFYAGKQGAFDTNSKVMAVNGAPSQPVPVYQDAGMIAYQVPYGTQITVDPQAAKISQSGNGKYYIRGIRESGRDNQETRAAFRVEEDRDYVVAYGVLSDAIAYTVRYLDQNGNALAAEQTYYGNVGDTLIIGYRYFDGYQPQAYNLQKTLTSNASENIFPFVYRPVQTAGGGGGGGGTTPTPGAVTPAGENPVTPPAGGGAAEAGTAPAAPEGGGGAEEGDAGAQGGDAETPEGGAETPEEPEELLNLDDEEVPLAGVGDMPKGEENAVAEETDAGVNWLLPVICIIVVVVGGLLALWYVKRRRKQEEENEENKEKEENE